MRAYATSIMLLLSYVAEVDATGIEITAAGVQLAAVVGTCEAASVNTASQLLNTASAPNRITAFEFYNFFDPSDEWAVNLIAPVTYFESGGSASPVSWVMLPGQWDAWSCEKTHGTACGTEGTTRWTIALRNQSDRPIGYFYMMWSNGYSYDNRYAIGLSSSPTCPHHPKNLHKCMYKGQGYSKSLMGYDCGTGEIPANSANPPPSGCGWFHLEGGNWFHDYTFRMAKDEENVSTGAWCFGMGVKLHMTMGSSASCQARISMMPNRPGQHTHMSAEQRSQLHI